MKQIMNELRAFFAFCFSLLYFIHKNDLTIMSFTTLLQCVQEGCSTYLYTEQYGNDSVDSHERNDCKSNR